MAITNAQQFKQLVNPPMKGKKRPGYRGEAAAASDRAAGRSAGRDTSTAGTSNRGDDFDRGSFQAAQRMGEARQIAKNLAEDKAQEPFETLIIKDSNLPGFLGMGLNALKGPRQKLLNRNVDFFRFDPRTRKAREKYGLTAQGYKDYMSARLAGTIDAAGNPLNQGDDDDDNQILFPQDMGDNTDGGSGDDEDPTGGMAFRFMNRGGMPMDAPTTGGIMDLETGRQMYFLGKLVKKATRAVKKIVKSPIGKAALAFGAYKFGPQILSGSGFGLGSVKNFKDLEFFGKNPNVNMGRLAGILSLSPFLFGQEEEEDDEQTFDRGRKLDIANIRANPYTFIPRRFAAEGGSMKEPVAKKTMPLIDMDGKEKDYRETGGFVDIGRMERADDVPARLSKNEFVFTADAVRNAGDGSVDKGAEVMYNMMKNLESGGEVSEESQGLEGARKMFQTSQRLEEVL